MSCITHPPCASACPAFSCYCLDIFLPMSCEKFSPTNSLARPICSNRQFRQGDPPNHPQTRAYTDTMTITNSCTIYFKLFSVFHISEATFVLNSMQANQRARTTFPRDRTPVFNLYRSPCPVTMLILLKESRTKYAMQTLSSRRERGARGALAVLPTLHGTAATVVAYASGRGMLDSLMLACPAAGTCTAPATTVARLGGQILEIVAGGWGDGGHGAFARGTVAVRSRYQLTVIKVSADVSHSTHTHKEFSFEVHRDIDNLPERSCGVAINHVLHMECAVILESGSLLCVGETVDTHHTPTSWLSGTLGSGAAIGCEYAHHPREVCVHRSSGLGLWDLRSPPKSCWRLLWDVGSEVSVTVLDSCSGLVLSFGSLPLPPVYNSLASSDWISYRGTATLILFIAVVIVCAHRHVVGPKPSYLPQRCGFPSFNLPPQRLAGSTSWTRDGLAAPCVRGNWEEQSPLRFSLQLRERVRVRVLLVTSFTI